MSGVNRLNETRTFELHETDEVKVEPIAISDGAPVGEPAIAKKRYPNLSVCLDPGHAASTGGKRSPYSLGKVKEPKLDFYEYKFTRMIACRLKPRLEEYGIDVFITTTEEEDGIADLKLTSRAQRANNHIIIARKKGIFISIHSDADGNGSQWTKANGWSCYTTKGETNSDNLADCLYDAAEEIFKPKGLKIRTDKSDGDRDWEQDFTVIYKANMPAVLVENFFYTNIDDTKYLLSEEGIEDILQVLLKGILKFADKFYNM